MILSTLLNIFSLVVFSTSSTLSTAAGPASATTALATTASATSIPGTTANNTSGNSGKGGADAVSLSYYMFALTILGAYFIQLLEH